MKKTLEEKNDSSINMSWHPPSQFSTVYSLNRNECIRAYCDDSYFISQGTQVKDVIIKPDAPNTLLLDKHADYIAAYGSKKDDYVSCWLIKSQK